VREIKFRAWDKKELVMFQVARFDFADYSVYSHLFGKGIPAEQCYLREFTGLHDKNGKDIYEGDIVETVQPGRRTTINRDTGESWESTWEHKTRSVVKWQDDNNPRWAGMLVWGKGTLEVIGNIYENPELLEGANE